MSNRRIVLPAITMLSLWLLSLPCLAGKLAVAGEEQSPGASTGAEPGSAAGHIVPEIPPVKGQPLKGEALPQDYLDKWQKQMRYNVTHGIPNPAPTIQWSGPMGHAPRLPNGMLGWEFDGNYAVFGCLPDPTGWIDGTPVFRNGNRISRVFGTSSTHLPSYRCPKPHVAGDRIPEGAKQ